MRQLLVIVVWWVSAGSVGCASEELPGPPIALHQVVPRGAGSTGRSHGEAELYLTPGDPSHTFWNDWEKQQDEWGTVTLKRVQRDGTVVVDFAGSELRARPNRLFPGTGVKVIASNPSMGTALLRTRWTHTVIEEGR